MTRALIGGVIAAACLTAGTTAAAQTAQPQPSAPPAKPAPGKETTVSGVTVSAAREAVETSIDRRSYSVANDLQAKTGNLADVLRNVPSVQVDVNGNVSLRGDGAVTVLVDGKPSVLFSKDTLAQALQSMPADQVDRIEVITNPSAEFRADGTAGIINLVLKKARGSGKTGSIRANANSIGTVGGTLSHGFNSDKLSVVDSLSLRQERRTLSALSERTQPDPLGGLITSRDVMTGPGKMNGAQARASMDYDWSKITRLTASLSGAWNDGAQKTSDDFTTTNGAGATTSAFSRDSVQALSGQQAQLDLALRRKEDKQELSLRASYGRGGNGSDLTDVITTTAPGAGVAAQQTVRNIHNTRANLSADWQKTLAGGAQLKAGYLLEYMQGVIDHAGGSGPSAAAIAPDPLLTDVFAVDEVHHQAYVTLQKKLGDVTVLGGLRGEDVHLDMDQRTLALHNEQDYGRLYPTLHLSWGVGAGKTMTASYSKRVSRPGPSDLDPFRFTANPTAAIEGNPNLKPQETHSFEVGFERRKGPAMALATLYHRQSDNAFSVVITDLGGGRFLQQRTNLGQQAATGLELTLGDKLSPKLTYNLTLNAYETRISDPSLAAGAERSAFASYGRANLNWQVTPKDFVQINVFANGKQLLPQGYGAPVVSGNIGYRHTVNDKVSWMLTIQDPFRTMKNQLVLDSGTTRERRTQRFDTQVVGLTLVWNFAGKPRDTGFDFGGGGGNAGSAVP